LARARRPVRLGVEQSGCAHASSPLDELGLAGGVADVVDGVVAHRLVALGDGGATAAHTDSWAASSVNGACTISLGTQRAPSAATAESAAVPLSAAR
jgi:hypothetical protein